IAQRRVPLPRAVRPSARRCADADGMDSCLGGCRAADARQADALRDTGRTFLSAASVRARLRDGSVIPAHPLALTPDRRLDEEHQRALTQYYLASGAGGIAVGVHTTQFAIR